MKNLEKFKVKELKCAEARTIAGGNFWDDFVEDVKGLVEGVKRILDQRS